MKGRLWLIVPWALFAAAALAWTVYWHWLAGESERRLRAWTSSQSETGASAEFGRVVRHGFPVLMRLELRDVAYASTQGGWRLATERADLHVQMLNPGHVIVEARAPIAVTRRNAVTNVVADALLASLRTREGEFAAAGIEADNLVLDDPAQEGVLYVRKLVVNARPDVRAAGRLQIAFDAQTATLPRPVRSFEAFGLDVARLRAALVLEQGAALGDAAPRDPTGPWRAAGGSLRIEALELNWGPLQTTGTGSIGLDVERRIEGQLRLPVARPGPVLTAMANGSSADQSARRALGLLAASYASNGRSIVFDIGARDGVLRLEGLPVRTLPPAY